MKFLCAGFLMPGDVCMSTELAESTVNKAQIFEDDGQYAKANSFSAKLPQNNDDLVVVKGDDLLIQSCSNYRFGFHILPIESSFFSWES